MKKINYYIGSNNQTHKLESKKALDVLSAYYEGMSVFELLGYWKGQSEKTLMVSIVCKTVDNNQVEAVCKQLNKELNQDAIMVDILDSNTLFIEGR